MKKALVLLSLVACASPEKPTIAPLTTAKTEPVMPKAETTHVEAAPRIAPPHKAESATFAEDKEFLASHGEVKVLEGEGGARVLLSAKYQGRVMTSAVEEKGRSFGWINRPFIEAGKTGTPFDNFGGEDRLWLGPEGGQYGLYFAPSAKYDFDNWQVPHAMQEGDWKIDSCTAKKCTFGKKMSLVNWSGTKLEVDIVRRVEVLDRATAKTMLGIDPGGVQMVGYQSENEIKNDGTAPWKKESGLLSLWVLGQFAPAADGKVVIPFVTGNPGKPIVNDAYFGKVPAERLRVDDKGYLVFRVDGQQRGKIGLGPARAKSVAGSYSASARTLTIVQLDPKPEAAGAYVNSMWEKQADPYAGDVINSYNDGPTAPGKPALGGFYEIETSSPAIALDPKKSKTHRSRTFHFVGDRDQLDPIAKAVLGVSLADL